MLALAVSHAGTPEWTTPAMLPQTVARPAQRPHVRTNQMIPQRAALLFRASRALLPPVSGGAECASKTRARG